MASKESITVPAACRRTQTKLYDHDLDCYIRVFNIDATVGDVASIAQKSLRLQHIVFTFTLKSILIKLFHDTSCKLLTLGILDVVLMIYIHLHCGWFASARINNPRLFKRLLWLVW
ncbi:transmembrane protein, putative [Medicago truncatula]|uniref:Transmembrane protein, putative n=1 Tax=Medicago truncatula TaxID=3880 RepID=G7ILR6_MEDTR|nr:transmembrane protein, putative [Medicago truncatula]